MEEKASGDRGPTAPQHTLRFERVLVDWLSSQRSANTRAAYRSDFEMFGRWCARRGTIPLMADTAALTAFQTAREAAGDSASTVRRRWSALSSFYAFAIERDLLAVNPTAGVVRPKVLSGDLSPTVRLSEEVVASCRAAAAALDPRLEALVALLVCDGLKVAEALALDIEDVSGRSPTTSIIVRRRGQSRRIVLDLDTARAIRRCVGRRGTGPIFVSEQSSTSDTPRRLTRFGADHLIRQLRTDQSTEPITASALRRFHIMTHRLAGADLEDIRNRAGLANIRGVRRYVDATTEQSIPGEGAD